MRFVLIMFLVLIGGIVNCGGDPGHITWEGSEILPGTENDDPFGDVSVFDDTDDPITQAVELICDAILGCNDGTIEDSSGCLDAVWSTKQIGDEFGIDDENVWSLDEAWLAVYDEDDANFGHFSVNETIAEDCHADLEDLSCTDVELGFSSGSDLNDSSNYENIENFIPESCDGMIQEV